MRIRIELPPYFYIMLTAVRSKLLYVLELSLFSGHSSFFPLLQATRFLCTLLLHAVQQVSWKSVYDMRVLLAAIKISFCTRRGENRVAEAPARVTTHTMHP
jgi:hypothetical protein